jgi:outer membrane protein assembly factor BamB
LSNDVEVKRPIFSLFVAGLWLAVLSAVLPANASVNVTQHHNHDSRDGLYIDPAFTPTNAANLARDTSFDGTIVGGVYAQPLYIENGPGGRAMVIAVTESNNVYALDAANGSIIWQRNVGTPITSGLPCGNISPLGITGTPIVDLASRSLFLDAETTPTAGTFKHLIYSLNVDTGDINAGWPVDVGAVVSGFTSSVQSERAALGIVGGILYVPYGGRFGDCGSYRGRLVGVQMNNPAGVMAWATTATGGGVWGPGGVANDGTNPFVVTGNTFGTGGNWGGGEAVIRFQPGPVFSGSTTDYWAPTNWFNLDNGDTDLGGSGPVLVDVPGATPPNLVVALGKDGNAYLLNRANLGGVSAPVASLHVSSSSIIQAAATYRTNQGTYVVFRASSSTLAAFRINPANPPTITIAWSVSQSGRGSPFVTSTDGTNNMIVWVVGSEGDQRLHGYDGDTGAVVYAGGGSNELMTGTRKFNTGIAARGRIYVANDNKVYAFSVPVPTLQLTLAVSRKTHGGAGAFDIPLPLSGSPGVECRTGGATGDYTLVFTFTNNVTSGNASVTSGIGSVSGMPTFSGNTMTVNLTGVANAQTLTVTLSGVTDEFSQVLPDTPVSVNMLIGDTSGNGVVNATDVAQTKAQVGQPVTSSNFRTDVNASGIINATDVAIVKAHSGQSVSAPHARARSSAAVATRH